MSAEIAMRARIAGVKAVASYLARLLATGYGAGLDVARGANPYEREYRAAWFAGFDEAATAFAAVAPASASFREQIERETWAARRAATTSRRRAA